jgi:hypothetical protein
MAQPELVELAAHERTGSSVSVLRKHDDFGIEVRNAPRDPRNGSGVAAGSKIECKNPHRHSGVFHIFMRPSDVIGFFIKGKAIIGLAAGNDSVEFFRYPKGGNAYKNWTGLTEPLGAVISK